MRYIGPYQPAATPSYAILAAASTAGRRDGLVALAAKVDSAARLYAASVPDVHTLQRMRLSAAEKEILKEGYDKRSAAMKRLLEGMRDSLPSGHRDLCPYCDLDSVYQLDHYLPKSRYPEFSLHGPNLLPICGRCNQFKMNSVVDADGSRIFAMPSGDMFLDQDLLVATLAMNPSPYFTFALNIAAPITIQEFQQAQRHFDRLQLADRYRRRANALLEPLRFAVRKGGRRESTARKVILSGIRSSASKGLKNGWELATYRAIVRKRHEFKRWLLA